MSRSAINTLFVNRIGSAVLDHAWATPGGGGRDGGGGGDSGDSADGADGGGKSVYGQFTFKCEVNTLDGITLDWMNTYQYVYNTGKHSYCKALVYSVYSLVSDIISESTR